VAAAARAAARRGPQTRDHGLTLSLTGVWRALARLACNGRSGREIAATLFMSQHAVADHVREVFPQLAIAVRKPARCRARPSRNGVGVGV